MNLFFLERTPLLAIQKLDPSPQFGDVIVYLRVGQDADGIETSSLNSRGINTLWGEGLLTVEASREIDRLGASFLDNWSWIEERDVSRAGDVSMSKLLDWEIGRLVSPASIIRTGEILRRAYLGTLRIHRQCPYGGSRPLGLQ